MNSIEPVIFKKMNPKLLKITDDGWVFQTVANYISDLFINKEDHVFGVEKLLDAPQCVKNIHYLWLFSCEVGSGGLHSYVINHCAEDLEWLLIHKALNSIQASELIQRFESCIRLGLNDDNICVKHDISNFTHMQLYDEFNTYEKIDNGIYELAGEPLGRMTASYIRNHKAEIFELRNRYKHAVQNNTGSNVI